MLPLVILASVLVACGTAIYLQRHRQPLPAAPSTGDGMLESLRMMRDLAGDLIATVNKVTAVPEPPHVDATHRQGIGGGQRWQVDMAELDYDPTDADPFLSSEFTPYAPPRYANDAPPPITHPLGIPGLQRPYALEDDPE